MNANWQKFQCIGRLTKDPVKKEFSNGGHVVNGTIAVNNPRKKADGSWDSNPTFFPFQIQPRGEVAKELIKLCLERLKKGDPVYMEGKLETIKWTDSKTRQPREMMQIRVFDIQTLEPSTVPLGTDEVPPDDVANKAPAGEGPEIPDEATGGEIPF